MDLLRIFTLPAFISQNEAKKLINKAVETFRHEDCAVCECFLGFLTQLELDGDQEVREYLAEFKPAREEVHSCLGCDPCSPGILYSEYLIKKSDQLS